MLTKDEMILAARAAAAKWKLPADVVCGMVERESTWNPWTIRYEPGFMTEYVQPLWSRGEVKSFTEAHARCFSWGLMQVMGQSARELGFPGDLASLCDPERGLDIGCLKFERLLAAHGDLGKALQAYNGGGNPNYASEVLALAAKYTPPAPSGGKAISA